jgi:hypothetical protein
MSRIAVLVTLLFICIVKLNIEAFKYVIPGRFSYRQSFKLPSTAPKRKFVEEANSEDMKYFGLLLANVTDTIEIAPEKALSMISRDAGWLLSHNLPKLVVLISTIIANFLEIDSQNCY